MPRIKQNALEYAAADFAREIRVAGAKLGLHSATAIAEYAGLDRDTMRRRLREPKSFKLGEILTLTMKLRMGPESMECLTRGGKVS